MLQLLAMLTLCFTDGMPRLGAHSRDSCSDRSSPYVQRLFTPHPYVLCELAVLAMHYIVH